MCVWVYAQMYPTLCDPMDSSLPGFSVHVIFQAIILERIAISFSSLSFWPRVWTWISCISWLAGGFFVTAPPEDRNKFSFQCYLYAGRLNRQWIFHIRVEWFLLFKNLILMNNCILLIGNKCVVGLCVCARSIAQLGLTPWTVLLDFLL